MKYTYFRDRAKKVHPSFLEETTTEYALHRLDPNIHMRDGAFHYDHSVHVLDVTQRCELAALAKDGEQGACRTLHGASTIYAKKMEGAEQSDSGGESGVADEVAANVRCFM